MTGDKLSSEELQARIEELDFANQQQMKALMSSKEESALKSEGLEISRPQSQPLLLPLL